MRTSAALAALGFLLAGMAGLLGAAHLEIPRRAMLATEWASPLSIFAGLLVGLVAGNRRYRIASLLALLGSVAILFGVLFFKIGGPGDPSRPQPPSVNEIVLWLGTALWLVALILGATALLQPREADAGT